MRQPRQVRGVHGADRHEHAGRGAVTTVFNGTEGWIKVNEMNIKVEKELLEEFKEMAYSMPDWPSLPG